MRQENRNAFISGPGAPSPGLAARRSAQPTSRLWLWIVAAFALQLAAWTAWFVVASKHRVAEVPLAEGAVSNKR